MADDLALPPGFTLDNPAALADIDGLRPRPQDISLDNAARSVARGIPIFGGLANRADAALNASPRTKELEQARIGAGRVPCQSKIAATCVTHPPRAFQANP